MKWLKRIIWFIFGLFILISITGYGIARWMEEDITSVVIREINKNLQSSVSADRIRFSFLKKFPRASLEFINVTALAPDIWLKNNPRSGNDTIFRFAKVFLEFNLPQVLRGQYNLTAMEAIQGRVNIAENRMGYVNYHFWKDISADTSSLFQLDLKNVLMKNILIHYQKNQSNPFMAVRIERGVLKGKFAADSFFLNSSGQGEILQIIQNKTNLINNCPFRFQTRLNVRGSHYKIEQGQLQLKELLLSLGGEYMDGLHPSYKITGRVDKFFIPEMIPFLSEDIRSLHLDWPLTGESTLRIQVKGDPSRGDSPIITGSLEMDNGNLESPKFPAITQGKVQAVFHYQPGKEAEKSWIDFKQFSFNIKGGEIRGRFTIFPFGKPRIRFKTQLNGDLQSFQQLFYPDSMIILQGKTDSEIEGYGQLKSLKNITTEDFINWTFSGILKVRDAKVGFVKENIELEGVTGKFILSDNLQIEDIQFQYQGDKYRLNGTIREFLPWLFQEKQPLIATLNLHSPSVHIKNSDGQKTGKEGTSSAIVFPSDLQLEMNFSFKEFKFDRFEAQNVSGIISYQPFFFRIHSLNLEAMGGNISGGGAVVQSLNRDFLVRAQTNFRNIDIQKAFYNFYNFGQNELTDKHLKGKISGYSNFLAEWDSLFQVKEPSILAETSVEIESGELIQYEPMLALSEFIEVSELEHIYFSKLKNEILIKNRTITIPTMDIHSTAFNISGSGIHDFDNNIEYKVKVSLSELLAGKAKKSKKENMEFGIESPDNLKGMSLFLLIKGNMNDFTVNYDKKTAVKNLQDNFRKERTSLKAIFKKEFGKGNSDSLSIPSINKDPKKTKFTLVQEEDENLPGKKNENKKASTSPDFKIEWDDESTDSLRTKRK